MRGTLSGRPDRVAWIIAGCAVAFMAAFAAGCGSSSSSSSGNRNTDMLKKVGKPEGSLSLVNWAGYVEPQWTKPFEKQTGCTVTSKVAGTSDEMVQLMRTGNYDGVSASGNASARLVDAGNVSPVNVDLVPNYKTIFSDLKDQTYNTFDGVHYGIPHGRGANLLMWNSDDVKPPDSWGIILDPKEAAKYKGKISAYDDPIYIADAAVYLKAHDKGLGIDNPYELDQKQFDAAVNLLKQQRANVGEYWSSATKQIASFANGDDTVGTTWQYQYFALKGEKEPVATIPAKPNGFLPTEGATGWSDTWMISSEAKHPNCMYLWMNYIVSPKANAEVAEYFGEAPAQTKACDETSDPKFCAKYHAADPGFWKRVYYWNTPLADCGDDRGEKCKDYNDWVSAWTSIKG